MGVFMNNWGRTLNIVGMLDRLVFSINNYNISVCDYLLFVLICLDFSKFFVFLCTLSLYVFIEYLNLNKYI